MRRYVNGHMADSPCENKHAESQRLLGVVFSRGITLAIVMVLLGYEVEKGILGLPGEPWYIIAAYVYLTFRMLWPLTIGIALTVDGIRGVDGC